MKFFLAILALVAYAAADVSEILKYERDAQIVKQDADVFPDKYQFVYETSNGISAQEQGVLKNAGSEQQAFEVQGENSYRGPNNEIIRTSYIANENGYQPQGAHLPTTPAPLPIPDYILRAIEYIRTHPPKADQL